MRRLPVPTSKSLRRTRWNVNKTRPIPPAPSALGDVLKANLRVMCCYATLTCRTLKLAPASGPSARRSAVSRSGRLCAQARQTPGKRRGLEANVRDGNHLPECGLAHRTDREDTV